MVNLLHESAMRLGFQLGEREAIDAILAALRMAGTALDLASPKRPRQAANGKRCGRVNDIMDDRH